MKKNGVICLVLLVLVPPALSAKGGGAGGVEYTMNIGSDILTALAPAFSGEAWLDIPTGSVSGAGAVGYGVTWDGFKIGGFGFGFFSGDFHKEIPSLWDDYALTSMAGGFGGLLTGAQYSYDPVVFAINTKMGVGGIGVNNFIGTFGLFGSADVELGFVLGRHMLISGFGGIAAILAFTGTTPAVLPILVPETGVRISWGSF